jgi:hypothetical protein
MIMQAVILPFCYIGEQVLNPAGPIPPVFKWYIIVLIVLFFLGLIGKLLLRATPIAWQVSDEVVKAFEGREIQTRDLPSEFRFITHETTLQEVLDKFGKPSRAVKVAIDANAGLGYALVSSGTGPALISTLEYHLPYHAAVIVMPEFPFEPPNRIRAVYYRPIQRELAAELDD